MGVLRRVVFPALRLVVWGVIAVALVQLAFGGTGPGSAEVDPLEPRAQIVEPTVEVAVGTVTNTVTVQGSVVADPPLPVRATLAGTVRTLHVAHGAQVGAGDPLLDIRLETPVEPTITTDPETGEQRVRENRPKVRIETVTAPIAGTLTLTALADQVVSVGDQLGTVAPASLSVTGTLTPDQQYRLVGAPSEAEVTLKGGPAPFVCSGMSIGAAAPDQGAPEIDPMTGEPVTAASGVVICPVPGDVTAFPGLGADLAITNGTAENALVVPVTAVQGSVQRGNVWVLDEDGGNTEREVSLGLTDGEMVQVVEGLAEGDEILLFVPVGDVMNPDMDPEGMYGWGG